MLPANTSPKLIPIPISTCGLPSELQFSFSLRKTAIISIAACMAQSAASSLATGAPHRAMRASPMNLSSVPPCSNTIPTISVKYSVSSDAMSSGLIFSDIGVNPRMSEKNTTTGRLVPPS